MGSDGYHNRVWMRAVAIYLAMAHVTTGQTVRSNDSVAELIRAQQLYDEGAYRPAVAILERMVGATNRDQGSTPEIIAATRLLAQVYHRSADYVAADRAAERYIQLSPQPDAEMLLILADSNLALGLVDEARRQLDQATRAFTGNATANVSNARLAIEGWRIADALRRVPSKGGADAARVAHAAPGTSQLPVFSPANFQQEQRFEVVALAANRLLDTNRIDEAIGLLVREGSLPAYDAGESAELKLRLADCYRRQATLAEVSADNAARQTAMAAEDRTLNSLAVDLNGQRQRAIGSDDFLKLLRREGTLHERKAELAQAVAQIQLSKNPADSSWPAPMPMSAVQNLQEAAKCYQQLASRADELDRANNTSPAASGPGESNRSGRAHQYRDVALCGLQRVYEALRLSPVGKNNERLIAALGRVSDRLVAERSEYLLATDPALYEAKRAQASVYASLDDRVSHERAATIYRDLIAYWEANPQPQRELRAAALIGLAEMLRALDQTKDAYRFALQANSLVAEMPVGEDPISRRDQSLLVARIENSLGVTSIALGEYGDALKYLTSADQQLKRDDDRGAELRRQNEQTLLVLSRVKVYRALLHKAEAQYSEAANRVREGRQLREQLDDNGDLLAYHLAEASVRLAQARDLMQQHRMTSQDASVRAALTEAEAALDRAEPLAGVKNDENATRHNAAALPYRYLRALLLRMRGDPESAAKALSNLVHDCEQQQDDKTAAKCYMQLAQCAIDAIAAAPAKGADATSHGPGIVSRTKADELLGLKLKRRTAMQQAAQYADRAVALFRHMDAAPEDELAVTALPSLHFQASYLAARLQILLATVDSQIARLESLLSDGTQGTNLASADATPADYRKRAIDLLEDAVRQAERPASSTTQVRLQRAQFFSRYAPAYDLLVDLYVASAVGKADAARFDRASEGFAFIRRAIEVADLARNRTFREQIDGWRQTAGNEHQSIPFDWNTHIREILDSDTALLMYHLDGPQLLDAGASHAGIDITPIGGGHLFVVLHQGQEIRYYRLRHRLPGTTQDVDLSRAATAHSVRRHIEWIESLGATRDWGRAEQRALTECLLPSDLLKRLSNPVSNSEQSNRPLVRKQVMETSVSPIQHLLIVTDGALHQLPFESLLLPESKDRQDRRIHYVIDELPPIRYGPSLSVLAGITERRAQREEVGDSVLTVGNPAYPAAVRQNQIPAWQDLLRQISNQKVGFVPLTHSEEECDSVYASFDNLPAASRTKLVQAAATEAAVRQHIGASRFVHIAAHGCVDYQNDNLFGALVFTPGKDVNDSQNDGLLQLREIYALNLSHCDLAVLSACQTYVGSERPLEAGTSMARAFLEQGARRVVCSQWSTDDRATTDLMKSFFNAIRYARQAGAEIDYAAALHRAKRAIRNDPERGSIPKYWAPFVLVGAR